MLKHLTFFLLAIFTMTALRADWNPSYLSLENTEVLEKLQNCDPFHALKREVAQELKNSWCTSEKVNLLMDLVYLIQPSICVEIGAFTGSSVLPIAATLQFIKRGTIFAVDAWSNKAAIQGLPKDDPNTLWWSQVDMNTVYDQFKDMVHKHSFDKFCIEVRSPSENAISRVPSGIDFLHLDGNFSETGASNDAKWFLPKVKKGGYILLSNFHTAINGVQTKFDSFCLLFDECEYICSIENDNSILFRKN